MHEEFSQTGGARLDLFNATFPFATLSGDSSGLHLSCMGREYAFPRDKIRKLSRHRGILSVGLRIHHSEPTYPERIIFWASVCFWTAGFDRLRAQLERLGYDIQSNIA